MKFTRAFQLLVLFSFVSITLPSSPGADDLKSVAKTVLQKSQKAVVTVKLVVKMRMQQQEQEQKIEVLGTVVDPSGLTIVSASSIDPTAVLKTIFDSMGSSNFKMDSKVNATFLILDDGTEIEADVVMKDTDLDMAFVRPRDTSKPFDSITLKPRGTHPQLLDEIFCLGRLVRSENRNLSLAIGSIRSVVKGPRVYYLCNDTASVASLGCVAFAADGSPIGIFVTKPSQMGGSQMGGLSSLLMRGGGEMNLPIPIIRPIEDVLEAIAQAKKAKSPPPEDDEDDPKPPAPKEKK